MLLLTCKCEEFDHPNADSSFKLCLDLVTLMEELFLVNTLPSPSIIFNMLKSASKRQKQKIFKINDKLFLTLGKQDPVSSDKIIFFKDTSCCT